MEEGRHLGKLFTVWGGRRMNRWPFPLWRWQSRVTLQNCRQPRIFQQQRRHKPPVTQRRDVTLLRRGESTCARARARCARACCNCALAWQVWINERCVSRGGETQTSRSEEGYDGGLALTTAARACARRAHTHTHTITTLSCDDDLIKAGHGGKKNPSKQRSRRGLSCVSRRSGTSGLLWIRSLQRLFLIKTEEAVREVVWWGFSRKVWSFVTTLSH